VVADSLTCLLTPFALDYVSISTTLAAEYVHLGKTSRAGLLFAQAESRIIEQREPAAPIDSAITIGYYLRYAEYLAVVGNHDKRYFSYPFAG
jgi:separase